MKRKLWIITIIGVAILCWGVTQSFAGYGEIYQLDAGSQNLLIVVNSDIYEPIKSSLDQYILDLEAEDYNVTLIEFEGNRAPEELKDYIKDIPDLKGAILVGDLPIAKFENEYGSTKHTYPVDLFYMDLDGEWSDTNNNGIYDTHTKGTGDLHPEIWVGRLFSSTLHYNDMDEVAVLNNYFRKNHDYRTGKLNQPDRALSYLDDDWSNWKECSLDSAYSDVTVVNKPKTTVTDNYKDQLRGKYGEYEWVNLCAHSEPTRHYFKTSPTKFETTYVDYSDIRDIDSKILFYNLFGGPAGRYNVPDYLAGYYIFGKKGGLAAICSTNIGGMRDFDKFYSHLGQEKRKTLGEAFKAWFNAQDLSGEDFYVYGMTLLGDPTLRINPPSASIDSITTSSIESEDVSFTFNLLQGNNFISLPIEPSTDDLATILASIDGKYRLVRADSNPPRRWEFNAAGKPHVSDLETIIPGRGYWIMMTEDATLTITGEELSDTSIQISKGWNFVGYNSMEEKSPEEALKSIEGQFRFVFGYTPGSGWQRYMPGLPSNLTVMQPGKGYWIYANTDCVWDLASSPPGQAPQTPWKDNENGKLSKNHSWYFTMGYRFTPIKDGKITKLGGYFNGDKIVYLWDSSQNLLASASVTSSNNWSYTAINPVAVTAGQTYTVAVYLEGSGGSARTDITPLPQTYGSVRIEISCIQSGNIAQFPQNNAFPSYMYGQVDIEFVGE